MLNFNKYADSDDKTQSLFNYIPVDWAERFYKHQNDLINFRNYWIKKLQQPEINMDTKEYRKIILPPIESKLKTVERQFWLFKSLGKKKNFKYFLLNSI